MLVEWLCWWCCGVCGLLMFVFMMRQKIVLLPIYIIGTLIFSFKRYSLENTFFVYW